MYKEKCIIPIVIIILHFYAVVLCYVNNTGLSVEGPIFDIKYIQITDEININLDIYYKV